MACESWVKKRAECSLEHVFQSLREIIERDVKAINEALPSLRANHTFNVENILDGEHKKFIVKRLPDQHSITFRLFPSDIGVQYDRATNDMVQVTSEWNSTERKCDLYIDGSPTNGGPYKLANISEKALSDFFFPRPTH